MNSVVPPLNNGVNLKMLKEISKEETTQKSPKQILLNIAKNLILCKNIPIHYAKK